MYMKNRRWLKNYNKYEKHSTTYTHAAGTVEKTEKVNQNQAADMCRPIMEHVIRKTCHFGSAIIKYDLQNI